MSATKTCTICAAAYTSSQASSKTCSPTCRKEHERRYHRAYGRRRRGSVEEERPCVICGTTFITLSRSTKRYCSPRCLRVPKLKPPVVQTRAVCGEQFLGSSQRVYCSDECREEQSQRRLEAWIIDHPESARAKRAARGLPVKW